MTSEAKPTVAITTTQFVDGAGNTIDAADFTIPFGEVEDLLDKQNQLSVTENDTHIKHLKDALSDGGDVAFTVTSSGGNEQIEATSKTRVLQTSDPDASDDSYAVGTVWVNTSKDRTWQCVDNTSSNAIWNFISGRIEASAIKTSTQNAPHSSNTDIVFDDTDYDTDSMFDDANDVVDALYDGDYLVSLAIRATFSGTSNCRFLLRQNGVLVASSRTNSDSVYETILTATVRASAGDQFSGRFFHFNDGSNDATIDTDGTFLTVKQIG